MQTTHTFTPVDLGETITNMDSLSQSGFGAIAAIARSALEDSEEGDFTPLHPEVMETALRAIWRKSVQVGNDINVSAEKAGFNHSEPLRLSGR